jgi:hypothetical protein
MNLVIVEWIANGNKISVSWKLHKIQIKTHNKFMSN